MIKVKTHRDSSSAAAASSTAGTAFPQPASPASSSPGARGTGGGRFTPGGGPLAHVPGLPSGQDASLPGVPAGGVQAPRAGARAPEPTLDSTDERAVSRGDANVAGAPAGTVGGSVDQAPALGARSPEPTFFSQDPTRGTKR